MAENQQYVRRVKVMDGDEAKVNVETDAAYNNRPQSGFEAATQSFCPMIEQNTSKKKFCQWQQPINCLKRKCNHRNNNCKQNFSTAETISSSESKMVQSNLENITEQGIVKIHSVTSDASAQIEKSIRDYATNKKLRILHYKCFVYKLRI